MNYIHLFSGVLVLLHPIRRTTAEATPVSGLWTDDHHHASNSSDVHNGWFIQNQMEINGSYHYAHLPQLETVGNDGTHYYGPFEEQHLGIIFNVDLFAQTTQNLWFWNIIQQVVQHKLMKVIELKYH